MVTMVRPDEEKMRSGVELVKVKQVRTMHFIRSSSERSYMSNKFPTQKKTLRTGRRCVSAERRVVDLRKVVLTSSNK